MKLSVGMIIDLCALALCVVLGSARDLNQRTAESINPDLKPKSDKKFFGKDYPDDHRLPVYSYTKGHENEVLHSIGMDDYFKHPYPTVQDSDRYDKDYVKDENDDDGYWRAQMDYDEARNKLAKELKELKIAMANAAKLKADAEGSDSAWKKALEKEAEMHKKEKEVDGEHDAAAAELDKVKQDVLAEADGTDEEITDLEDCKKKLIQKKTELKKLMDEKAGAEKTEADKQSDEDAKEVIEKEAEKVESDAEKKLADEQQEHGVALKSYEEEKAEYDAAVAALNKQAEVLNKYRKADPDGGVYSVNSNAAHVGLAFSALLAVLISVA